MRRVYYVSSYFFDRAVESGIVRKPGAAEWRTTPRVGFLFSTAAERFLLLRSRRGGMQRGE
jgi:hypothetical protein